MAKKPISQSERRYHTTLDDATHKLALAKMKADKVDRTEFVRRCIAAYLNVPTPEVKPGRRWPSKPPK